MNNSIKIIDSKVVEKIAAGEVVERPSSIIKELVENSIDANSKNIEINIDRGGKELLIVKDDGLGIEENQIELSVDFCLRSFGRSVMRKWRSKPKRVGEKVAKHYFGFKLPKSVT